MQNATPLRYPGGKAALTDLLAQIIRINCLGGSLYVEPFAGGGGAALGLLYSEVVNSLVLNDLDPAIYAFWDAVTNHTAALLKKIDAADISIAEWRRQRTIYRTPSLHNTIDLGFATLFLNRCNRSGIIVNAGPIGGIKQAGRWTLDVRFNKEELQRRVEKVAQYGRRVRATNDDVLKCLADVSAPPARRTFVYLDPPYYRKGPCLYLNALQHRDHLALSMFLREHAAFPWVMTYDDHPAIRAMYSWAQVRRYRLRYSAAKKAMGVELLICPRSLTLPTDQSSKAVEWVAGSVGSPHAQKFAGKL